MTTDRPPSASLVQRLLVALVLGVGLAAGLATQRAVEDGCIALIAGGLVIVILAPMVFWDGRPRHGGRTAA
jgi:hypothetical protein